MAQRTRISRNLVWDGHIFILPPAWNGVATSSSPFPSFSQGDEDIAAPKTILKGGSVKTRPSGIAPYLRTSALKPQGNETSEQPGAVQNSQRNLPKPQ
jgi:hypothetical protein